MKTKNLTLKIVSIILAIVSFISLAFKFVLTKVTTTFGGTSSSSSSSLSFNDWLDVLDLDAEKLWAWKVSRVLMIITLVVIAIIALVLVIEILTKNKQLKNIIKYLSFAGLIIAAAFIIFFVIGCILQSESGEYVSAAVFPHVGPILLALTAIISSVCSLQSIKK